MTHDSRPGLSVVAGPSAEASDDPACEGERAFGMRVLLALGSSFEAVAERLDERSIVGFEAIVVALGGGSVTSLDELHDGDGGDGCDRGKGDDRLGIAELGVLDTEAGALQGPEHLLDGPSAAIDVEDLFGPLGAGDLMAGQQQPADRLALCRRG